MMIRIYKIEAKALAQVKKTLEEQERVEVTGDEKKIVRNEFIRAGYTLRDAKSMGFTENCSYLYLRNEEDDFFKRNEPKILIEGVKKLDGQEFEKVKHGVEKEAEDAAIGVGAVFGQF